MVDFIISLVILNTLAQQTPNITSATLSCTKPDIDYQTFRKYEFEQNDITKGHMQTFLKMHYQNAGRIIFLNFQQLVGVVLIALTIRLEAKRTFCFFIGCFRM